MQENLRSTWSSCLGLDADLASDMESFDRLNAYNILIKYAKNNWTYSPLKCDKFQEI